MKMTLTFLIVDGCFRLLRKEWRISAKTSWLKAVVWMLLILKARRL
jgi:hypothetical protein